MLRIFLKILKHLNKNSNKYNFWITEMFIPRIIILKYGFTKIQTMCGIRYSIHYSLHLNYVYKIFKLLNQYYNYKNVQGII